jgi:hypothetical protein
VLGTGTRSRQEGAEMFSVETFGSRDGYCCYLIGHSDVRRRQLPSRAPGRRQESALRPTTESGSNMAHPQGDMDKGPHELWKAGQCTPRKQVVFPLSRTLPTRLPMR